MAKFRVVIGAMSTKATVLAVVGVGAPMMQDIVTGGQKELVPVPLVMVKFKVAIGVTKAKATVKLAVVVAGVAKLAEEDQSALAAAGTMEQSARTNGVMGANQTAMSAKAHGLEEDQSALAVVGTMGQTALINGVMEANQTAMFALVHGLEVAVHLLHLHHQLPHLQLLQRQPPQHAFGTALEDLVLVPLCEGLNQCIVIAMPCLPLPQTIHMEPSFMEVLQSLQAWEEGIGWQTHVENAGRSLVQVMHQDMVE